MSPGDQVGLCVPRGHLPFLTSAALLWLGASYVPLDPSHPAERLQYVLRDVGVRRIFVADAAADVVAPHGRDIQLVPDLTLDTAHEHTEVPMSAIGDGLAYVLHTSGSTGRPKGVPIRHRNVLAMIRGFCPLFTFDTDEVWPLLHAYTFDVSVWEMWGGVAAGACLVTVDDRQARDPWALAMHLANAGVTTLHIVPSVFRHVAETVVEESLEVPLRKVVFAGERLNRAAVRTWRNHGSGSATFWFNVYGITETTVYNSFHAVRPADLDTDRPTTPIGRPAPGSSMRVVGEDLRELPPGEAGELLISGPQLSEGYVGLPDLTRERFVTAPDGSGPWYRTGDVTVADEAGVLHFVGRLDDQVKVRGVRIELGEIEHALRSLPWLRDAAVVTTVSRRGEVQLAAAIVPTHGVGGDIDLTERDWAAKVREELANILPWGMLPQRIIAVDRLPQNSSGKLDRPEVTLLFG